jgi:flagellar secretion chaperone FliS
MMVAHANTAAAQQHYLIASVQSASKEQLLLMLFDGAIRFLKVARKAMDTNDTKSSHEHLLKTQKILTELMATLDMKAGGEPAQNLMALYEYYYYRLVQANLKKDGAMVDEVTEHLVNWRNTWEEAIRISHGYNNPSSSGPNEAPPPTSSPSSLNSGLEKSKGPSQATSFDSETASLSPGRTYQA